MTFDVYENFTCPTIKRYFIAMSNGGRITKGLGFYHIDGNNTWEVQTGERAQYYTDDLKKAKAGQNMWMKHLGRLDLLDILLPKLQELDKEKNEET